MLRIIITLLFGATFLNASDTLTVQTLTFDSVYTRRGVWTFPDNPHEYRKILMSYTLKCDPKTPHDSYNCGEWDYLTYTTVHQHTGEYDTSYTSHPLYKIGRTSPDTIKYSLTPQKRSYEIMKSMRMFESGENELRYSDFEYINDTLTISVNNQYNHFQFLVNRDLIKNSEINRNIQRIRLKTDLQKGDIVKNIKIRAAQSSVTDFEGFQDYIYTDLYDYSVESDTFGILDITFNEDFKLNPLRGALFDISIETETTFNILSVNSGRTVQTKNSANGSNDYYSQFDGTNDFIETDINEELSGTREFSVEGWFKIDEWKQWTHLFGKGGRTGIELGPNEGQIYCIVRSYGNTHGNVQYAVQKGKWFHLAMTFDGTQEGNRDKLKLYINGIEKTLTYTGTLPSKTEVNDIPFTISSLRHNTSALNGAADNIRIWNKTLSEEEILSRMYLNDLSDEADADELLANIYFNSNDKSNIENDYNISLYGKPQIIAKEIEDQILDPEILNYQPAIELFEYDDFEYTEIKDTITMEEDVEPIAIYEYAAEQYDVFISNQTMVWLPGYQYSLDINGNKIDSVYYTADETLFNEEFEYKQAPTEIINNVEIGRFITPYGINLDLGPEGFEWMYDVTDYAPLLTGEVDLSAGNLQELIDIKFYFIEGTPPRKVEEVTQIWGPRASYRYSALDNDDVLSEKEIELNPNAEQFKVITRLTGHGHQSNTGNAPHCCEWKDNSHYLYVNGNEVADWKIFRYTECGENPVFPQGGTWPGAREGWCPGDIVYDYVYEVSDYIDGNTASFDYDITDVPASNQGMGKGNYVVAMHLIQYAESEFENDAEIYDIIAPNSWDYYSRQNPLCLDPIFKVRNNGTEPISTMKIKYGVSGNEMLEYDYNWGNSPLKPNEIKTLDIYLESSDFWIGDGNNIFTIEITEINGIADEYAENNISQTQFNMPDLFDEPIVIVYRTNLRASHFSYEIYDGRGEKASYLNPNKNNTTYRDTIEQSNTCMTFNLVDQYSYGLSYWAYPDQGNGFLRIEDLDGNVLKTFNPDFGRKVFYSFRLGNTSYVNDSGMEFLVNVFPNPAKEKVKITSTMNLGDTHIRIYDLLGNKIEEFDKYISEGTEFEINVSDFAVGDYFIEFNNGKYRFSKRILKK